MDIMHIISTSVSILATLLYFVEGYFFYRILCYMAKKRDGWIWTAIIYFSSFALSPMVIFPNDLFNVTLNLIWFTAVMMIAFHGSIWQKLASVAILYPLIISQNFLVLDILGHLLGYFGRNAVMEIFCSIADTFLHLFFWYVVYRLYGNKLIQMRKLFDNKIWILLGTICLASLVNITTCIYYTPKESYKMWPAAFACFVTNLGSLFLAEYFTVSIQRNMERKNLKLQKNYYEELEQNQLQIRKFRHDINNHISVIHSLFRSGKHEDAEKYLAEMEAQIAVHNRAFCKNSIVNAVLNVKYNLALENHIDCFFHIDLQKLTGIDSISLCCLFSNTLDNAIEASLKIPDYNNRRISAKARVTENGYFSYEITNQKVNPVVKQKGSLQTSKKDSFSHGLGLSNVREVVEKYSGALDISYTDDTFTVTVLIGNA